MTQDEFHNLTPEEIKNFPEESFIQHLKRFNEERYIDYGKMLQEAFKNKIGDEEYKEILRWGKNESKSMMEKYSKELEHIRHGLNPPYCYPEYWTESLKIERIYDRYDSILEKLQPEIKCESNPGTSLAHLRWMLSELRKNEMKHGKRNRWLGFIQGIMIAANLATVEEERNFTRPIFQRQD